MFSAPARSGTFVATKVLLQIQSSGTLLPHTQQVHRSQSLVTCDARGNGLAPVSGRIVTDWQVGWRSCAPDGGLQWQLMLLGFCSRASLADALPFDSKLFKPETRRKFDAQLHRSQGIEVQVGNGPAMRATQMAGGMAIAVDAPGAVVPNPPLTA